VDPVRCPTGSPPRPLWLTVGVVPGAAIGARAAIRAEDHRLRAVFGAFLSVVTVLYGLEELAALV
jgi:uncharacterized membrane protein YfcA